MRAIKLVLFLLFISFSVSNVNAGFYINETENADNWLVGFFDLRERETFIQLTNVINGAQTLHIQIFDVANNCNENNFFDTFTGNDTHVYNLRDIITNDGNPSGVVLPNNSYGIFSVIVVDNPNSTDYDIIGNLRIEDSNGYEYRTNLAGLELQEASGFSPNPHYLNFNTQNGVTLSDVVGIALDDDNASSEPFEFQAANLNDVWINFDVDIFNNAEVPFSCRNVIFACTDQDNPLLEGLLEFVNDGNGKKGNGSGSVASFEYGINDAIPHSKSGELLCPGNNISEGMGRLAMIDWGEPAAWNFVLFFGLNNGNGRGSFDIAWRESDQTSLPD